MTSLMFMDFLSSSLRGPIRVRSMPVVGGGLRGCWSFDFLGSTGVNQVSCEFDCFGVPTVLLLDREVALRSFARCISAVEADVNGVDSVLDVSLDDGSPVGGIFELVVLVIGGYSGRGRYRGRMGGLGEPSLVPRGLGMAPVAMVEDLKVGSKVT